MAGSILRPDPNALAYWMRVRRVNCRRIEQALKLGNGTLGQFLNGRTNSMAGETYLAVAEFLGVPLDAVLTAGAGGPSGVVRGQWTVRSTLLPDHDRATMAEYAAVCAGASFHWTVHRGLNSYLKHPEHFLSGERDAVRAFRCSAADAEDYVRRAGEFKSLMGAAQGTSRSEAVHWVVTREAAFAGVANPDWVEATVWRVRDLGLNPSNERLVIAMLPDRAFAALDRRVTEIVGSPDWVAVNLVDGRYALVQTDPARTLACYHPGVVGQLARLLQAAVRAADPDFPAPGEGTQRRKYVTRRTLDFLARKERELRVKSHTYG